MIEAFILNPNFPQHLWIWILIEYEYGYPSQERHFRLAQKSAILVEGVRFTILLFILLELKFEVFI